MKSLARLIAPAALTALAACSSLDTSFDYDTQYDFAPLKTYSWLEERDSTLVTKRVRAAVDEELARRGYRAAESAPDFLVATHVSTQEKVQVTDWGYTCSPRYGWYGGSHLDVWQYQEGTLLLDVVDPKSRQLVWRGSASRVVESSWTPEEREKVTREAVAALLERFPPR
jgi:hypothetical protein